MSADPAMKVPSMDVLNVIAGVLFFGTPHTKTKEPEHWCRLTKLLNFVAKLPKTFLAHSEADANAAAIICEDFEQSGLEAPVLSIYETRPTKVRSPRWLLKDTVIVSADRFLSESILLTVYFSWSISPLPKHGPKKKNYCLMMLPTRQ